MTACTTWASSPGAERMATEPTSVRRSSAFETSSDSSLTLKLVGLVGIFIALPIVLYSQFESADRQMRDLVTRAIQDRSKLIGHALAPVLRTLEPGADGVLNAELAKFASDGTVLRLMVQPVSPTGEAQP